MAIDLDGLCPQQASPTGVMPLDVSLILLLVGLIGRWRWPVIAALLLLWVKQQV